MSRDMIVCPDCQNQEPAAFACDTCNGDGEIRDPENYDPTPWCTGCGARRRVDCHCGPLADND